MRTRLLLIGVVLAGLLFSAAPARAQMSGLSGDRCASSAEGESGLGGGGNVGGGAGGGGGGSWGGSASTTTTTLSNEDKDGEDGLCGGLLDEIAPGPNPGPNPSANYDIGYDEGGIKCVCAFRRVVGLITNVLFSWNTFIVRVGLGIINWALDFQFVRVLMGPAQRVSDAYQNQIVDRSGLAPLFLFLCAFWAAMMAFTGRFGRGAAELGTSLLILGVAAAFWTNPGSSLQRGLEFTAGVSSEIAAVGTGADVESPTSTKVVGQSMAAAIHKAFVERPHELINWGEPVEAGHPCRAVYEQAVATGPWGTSSKPRVAMKEAGCPQMDKFNRNPSPMRLASAGLVMIASLLLIIMLIIVTYELIKAQLEVLASLVIWPFALLFGALPGRGRMLFWHWIGATAMALARVLAMMLLLALTLTAVAAVLSATSGEKLIGQMLMVIVVVVVGIFKRRGILEGSKRTVQQFTQSMSGRVGARGSSWLSPTTAGFTGGALAAKAQHAFQAHGQNSRSRRLLDLTEDRNAIEAGRDTGRFGFGGDHVENVLFMFNAATGTPTPPPYEPRYQPPRPRPGRGLDAGPAANAQGPRVEPGALGPAPGVIPLDAGSVREAEPVDA